MCVTLLHGHATENNCSWIWRASKSWCISLIFWRSICDSDLSRSFSVRTSWLWCATQRNPFNMSWFSILSRFTRFLRLSRCFCFLIRDRRADSRFDTIRLRFRSSITGRWLRTESGLSRFLFVTTEPDIDRSELSEPELENTGSCNGVGEKTEPWSWWSRKNVGSWSFHGVKPPSNSGKRVSNTPSETSIVEKPEDMISWVKLWKYVWGGR